jgi:uncharacterized membrane protein YcaP (DUF421 family)
MDGVIRGAVVYMFLLLLFRLSGQRTLAQITTFDLVLLLIISEASQQALIGNDNSMTHGAIVVTTLVGLNIVLSLIKQRSKGMENMLEGMPLVLVDDGKLLPERMNKVRVDEDDILEAARDCQGLERLDQIKYAVLERSGAITIIPRDAKPY